jgi:hypothetical protein
MMPFPKFILHLLIGLLSAIYVCCLFLAFDSYNFFFWVLAITVSIGLTGVLFFAYRSKKWRFSSLFPIVIVLIGFSFFSPVRPFLSFFFSLDTDMTLPQVRTSLNHNFSAKSGFSLPREDSFRLSEEEQAAGISKLMYVVDPSDGTINCDMVVITFDRESRLVAARYSSLYLSLMFPSIFH